MIDHIFLKHTCPRDIDIHEFFCGLIGLRFSFFPLALWELVCDIEGVKSGYLIWLPFLEIKITKYSNKEERDSAIAKVKRHLEWGSKRLWL